MDEFAACEIEGVEAWLAADFILPSGSAGGPVLAANGTVVGLTSFDGGPEDTSQRSQPRFRVGQVMKHAGRDDQVETLPQGGGLFQLDLVQLEVMQLVLLLQELLVGQ